MKNLPCIEGWQVSISAALHLVQDLHNNHKIKFLLTSRLNQDCIEDLFSVIRGKGGHRDNPDIGQFTSALQQVMLTPLWLPAPVKAERMTLMFLSLGCNTRISHNSDKCVSCLQPSRKCAPFSAESPTSKCAGLHCRIHMSQDCSQNVPHLQSNFDNNRQPPRASFHS
ncbi:transposable element p transposase [Plakobranchus ocellatus]|uniref:Transposable element p transposase n=1 Tax=Plakobranchus ocellatus TaxID=259542 RepID=A0AAV4CDT2_9GAST|nr:transposable element p transposase [Plakobranchus ocellatus]